MGGKVVLLYGEYNVALEVFVVYYSRVLYKSHDSYILGYGLPLADLAYRNTGI
ncbi:MAG: hypothetical protein G5Z42_05435 [Caldisphaeraceae archaeon]|nr:hypothetical protein [Caldisphaeraceae archaeon]